MTSRDVDRVGTTIDKAGKRRTTVILVALLLKWTKPNFNPKRHLVMGGLSKPYTKHFCLIPS